MPEIKNRKLSQDRTIPAINPVITRRIPVLPIVSIRYILVIPLIRILIGWRSTRRFRRLPHYGKKGMSEGDVQEQLVRAVGERPGDNDMVAYLSGRGNRGVHTHGE